MKKFLFIVIALLSVLLFTACGKNQIDKVFELKTEEDLKAAGNIEIKLRVPSGVISTSLTNLLPEFEKEWPNVKVDLDIVSSGYDGLLTQNVYDLNNSTAPTLTIGYPDHLALYLSGDGLIDLNPYIESEKDFKLDDFVQSYLPENQISDENDHYYGLPLNKSTEVLVYNKTVFDAMNYELPTTWDEVQTLGAQILADVEAGKLDNITEVKFSSTDKKPSKYLEEGIFYPFAYDSTDNAFITMCRQWDAEYTARENVTKGYALFNNDNAKAGLKYFQDMASKKLFAIAETFDTSYASNAFKNLQCIMTIGSSAGVGYNKPDGDKFEIGVAPVPTKDAEHKYVIQQGTNICILSQSTNLQRGAAWQLIKFLTSTENTVKFCTASGGYLPVRLSGYETQEYIDYLDPDINFATYYYSLSAQVAIDYRDSYTMFVDPAFVGSSTIRDEVGTLFSKIIVLKKDIATELTNSINTLGPKYMKKAQ